MSLERERPARCLNATMKPLPVGYPYVEVTCQCGNDKDCEICNGRGTYYEYKRIKGQKLPDEMHESSDLGAKPDW